MTYELKILPEYFEAVVTYKKTFEIRKNDRNFHVGDKLILKEWYHGKYTGREVERWVSYILFDWQAGLKDGYCIMSLKRSAPMKEIMTREEKMQLLIDSGEFDFVKKISMEDFWKLIFAVTFMLEKVEVKEDEYR